MKNKYLLASTWLFLFSAGISAQNGLPETRKIIPQKCYISEHLQITIELWDAGIEDNDTVTLFLNNEKILEKHRLSKARESFSINIRPGENELVLHAENLGDIPNNTAAFSVNGSETMSLNSGLETSGSMKIYFAPSPQDRALVSCQESTETNEDSETAMLKANPALALPSHTLLSKGIRKEISAPAKKVEIQACYNAPFNEVSLLIWDCGVEDDDTVSLLLNGTWILNNYRLTKEPRRIPVKLQKGENIVLLYAHNLGSIPANTAALAVEQPYSAGKKDIGMMISDRYTCGAVRISYGLSDEYGNSVPPCLGSNTIDSSKEPEIIHLQKKKLTVHPPSPAPGTQAAPNPPVYRKRQNTGIYPPVLLPLPQSPSGTIPETPGKDTPPGGRKPGDNPSAPSRNTPPKPRP